MRNAKIKVHSLYVRKRDSYKVFVTSWEKGRRPFEQNCSKGLWNQKVERFLNSQAVLVLRRIEPLP